ncbi:MAG: GNAT family N-acetyltransferase [Alphaproteobacteria bacterium]|nr:GNAT family N-acetyltransferase [Alphaproteobacteria bacterium]
MLNKNFMPEIITGSKIKLVARNKHDYDADYWYEIDKNRLFLREYLLWVDSNNSLQDVVAATDLFIDWWNNGKNYAYSIVLTSTGKAIGSIDIHGVDYANHSAEIGYWLAEEHNGKGYMSEALKLIEKASFDNGINRLIIRVEADNIPSCRVAERNNYIFEGTHKQMLLKYDVFKDVNCYAKLKNA